MHVDPFLKRCAANTTDKRYMNYSSVEQLFGTKASKATIDGLARMQQCLPDFDTAGADHGSHDDPFRAMLYRNPMHTYGPLEILSLPWVYEGARTAPLFQGYSSTNFVLLGLLLAQHQGVSSWEELAQSSFIPSMLPKLPSVVFANKGVPSDFTRVVGYDRT